MSWNICVIYIIFFFSSVLPKIIPNCSYDLNATTGLATAKADWITENTVDTPILLNYTSSFKVTPNKVMWNGKEDSTETLVLSYPPSNIPISEVNGFIIKLSISLRVSTFATFQALLFYSFFF